MKKLTTILIAAALATPMTMAAPATAIASANDQVETCRFLVDIEVFPTQGACMSDARTRAPSLCRQLREFGILDFLGFRNIGECVSTFRSYN